jgi:hypothetical protein
LESLSTAAIDRPFQIPTAPMLPSRVPPGQGRRVSVPAHRGPRHERAHRRSHGRGPAYIRALAKSQRLASGTPARREAAREERERERARGAEERETPSLQPPRLPPSPPQPPPRRGARRRRREEALEGSRRGRRRLRLRQATRSRGSAAGWCIGVQRLAGAGRCSFSVSPLDPLAAGAFARASPPPRIEGSG